jgi:hypothetical protein
MDCILLVLVFVLVDLDHGVIDGSLEGANGIDILGGATVIEKLNDPFGFVEGELDV